MSILKSSQQRNTRRSDNEAQLQTIAEEAFGERPREALRKKAFKCSEAEGVLFSSFSTERSSF